MKENKLKLITKVLAILVICLVSFVGMYVQKGNKMENVVKGVSLGKDLTGYREVIVEVSDATKVTDSDGKVVGNTDNYNDSSIEQNSYTKTEEKVNNEENLNVENYKKVKEILQTRLEKFGVDEYNLSLDEQTGKIYIQLPENDRTDDIVSNLIQTGKLELKDSKDSSKVLLNNEDLKEVSAVYNTTESGTTVYLDIKLNKAGKEKLKDISTNEYATLPEKEDTESDTNTTSDTNTESEEDNMENATNVTAEVQTEGENVTTENAETDENTTQEESTESKTTEEEQKKVTLSIDGSEMVTTSFDEPIENGTLDLTMNKASKDSSEINKNLQSASTIAVLLNSEVMPLTYKVSENQYVKTGITSQNLKNVIIAMVIIGAVLLVYIMIKYKGKGILGAISNIGYMAIFLLVLRYTNVELTIEGILGIVISGILNYWFTIKLLKGEEKAFMDFVQKVIPILIIAIVGCFISWAKIASFGMAMFWGIAITIIYNLIVTRNVITKVEK